MSRFVKFDKANDGVEVGLISVTNGRTTEWYSESVADYYHDYFAELKQPLGWNLDVLIICGHGSTGGNSLGTDAHSKVSMNELVEFIQKNMKVKKVLVNACHAGDSGGKPGNSFANKLNRLLDVDTYGPVESIARMDSKERFYTDKEYHWNAFAADGTESALGKHTLQELVRYVLHGANLDGVTATKESASVADKATAEESDKSPKTSTKTANDSKDKSESRPAAKAKTKTKDAGEKHEGTASVSGNVEIKSVPAVPAFVDIDKDNDGVKVGLISVTNDSTAEWYAESVANCFHNYFTEAKQPLGWNLDVLIVYGFGRGAGTDTLGRDGDVLVSLSDLVEFIRKNVKAKKVLLFVGHAGDSGEKKGQSFGNEFSKALHVKTYAPFESVACVDSKGKFYTDVKYSWNRYEHNTKSRMGKLTLQDLIRHVLYEEKPQKDK